jgi:hypothetical protein
MEGWQLYVGVYNPNKGGTYETAEWTCLSSSPNIVDLLYYSAFPEMMKWNDGGKQAKPLQEALLEIHAQLKQIDQYIQAQFNAANPRPTTPVVI